MSGIRQIACQLSGSVDSVVAALLLKKKGFRVTGLFVHSPYDDDVERRLERMTYAAREIGINLEEIHLPQHHWQDLEKTAASEYCKGGTPDLSILYEKHITFGAIRDYVSKFFRINLLATAHYARTSAPEFAPDHVRRQGVHLFRGVDQRYDDSAILALVPQTALRMAVFPLGEFTKDVVSHVARSAGLGSFEMDGHQGHVEQLRKLEDTVLNAIPSSPGVYRNLETYGITGSHEGLHLLTVGQQIAIDGQDFWVASKDVKTGEAMLVPTADHPGLYTDTLFTALAHWTFLTPYNFFEKHSMRCDFRLRAHGPLVRAQLTVGAHNEWCGNDHIILSSTQPLHSVTPGQRATFYRGEEAIGSAVILRPGPSHYAMFPAKRKLHSSATSTSDNNNTWISSPLRMFCQKVLGSNSTY